MKNFKSESEFNRWFCKQLEAVNAEVVAFVGSKMQRSGVPDRYVCHVKFRGWLEMKRNNKKLRTNQRILTTRLNERGDVCLVVRHREGRIEIEDPATGERLVEPMDLCVLARSSLPAFVGGILLRRLRGAAARMRAKR